MPFLASWTLLRANARALARKPGAISGLWPIWSRACGGARARSSSRSPSSRSRCTSRRSPEGADRPHPRELGLASGVIGPRHVPLTGSPWSFAGHASDIYLDAGMLGDKIREAKFVLTCTRHNKEYLDSVGGPDNADKIVVSYHGVDLQRFRPLPAEHPVRSASSRWARFANARACPT